MRRDNNRDFHKILFTRRYQNPRIISEIESGIKKVLRHAIFRVRVSSAVSADQLSNATRYARVKSLISADR